MGKIVAEGDQLVFYRNIESERAFNEHNTKPFGSPENWRCEIPVEKTCEQHKGIFKNFAAHVLDGEPLLAPGEEGIYGLTISNAIHYSAWTGGWANVKQFPHDDFYRLLQEKIQTSTFKKAAVQKRENVDMSNTF